MISTLLTLTLLTHCVTCHEGPTPAKLLWGIPDSTAYVGRAFVYRIPSDAFQGDDLHLWVGEAGENQLPSWLEYDESSQTLYGVAQKQQEGQTYLTVKAIDKRGNIANDVFAIQVEVATRTLPTSSNEVGRVKCGDDEPLTHAALVFDQPLTSLTPHARVTLLNQLSTLLSLPLTSLYLLPQHVDEDSGNILVSGHPNPPPPVLHDSGMKVEWVVACAYSISSDIESVNDMPNMAPVTKVLESGEVGAGVGLPLVSWHLYHRAPTISRRLRRQLALQYTVMPQATLVVPTPTLTHTTTSTSSRRGSKENPTHVLPGPATATPTGGLVVRPSLESSPPATTHSHRHHHTTHKQHPSRGGSPTSTSLPIRPTQIDVDIHPTSVYSTHPHVVPTVLDNMTTSPSPPLPPTPKPGKEKPAPPTKKPRPRPTPLPPVTGEERPTGKGSKPKVKNEIGIINAVVGEVLRYKVKSDVFYDSEDGDTNRLRLIFKYLSNNSVIEEDSGSWIQLDSRRREFIGLPLPHHPKETEYMLEAVDSDGLSVHDVFLVTLHQRSPERPFNHRFTLALDIDYDEFVADMRSQVKLIRRISRAFGDQDSKLLTVISFDRGSVIISWGNNTLPYDPCPLNELEQLKSVMLDDEGEIRESFQDDLRNSYPVLSGKLTLLGSCLPGVGVGYPSLSPGMEIGVGTPSSGASEDAEGESEDGVWVTTILPAVVIGAMLLLAALIACILYRRRRKGKMSDEDKSTFVKKGVPVIFTDEVEDANHIPAEREPMIMREEKPPLPPPQYGGGNDYKDEPAPTAGSRGHGSGASTGPYQPPPPFSSNTSQRSNGRPLHVQQSYRQPPPYVPP